MAVENTKRNIEITKKRLAGVSVLDLIKEYKLTETRIRTIIHTTKAKYPELVNPKK